MMLLAWTNYFVNNQLNIRTMKKILLFALPLLAMCIVSCNRVEIDATAGTEDTPQSVGETVNVSFAFKGDITIEESPLSKAAGEETESTDLYGISVYYDEERDGKINDVYGYGLFDNIADMNISLLTGYKYKFVCSLVKDGKNEVAYNNYRFYSSDYFTTEGYCMPFCNSGQSYREDSFNYSYPSYRSYPTPVKNEFILGGSSHLTGLGKGGTNNFKAEEYTSIYGDRTYSWSSLSSTGNGGYKQYPETDRYYGETTDYTPTEGGVVSIEMKRCVFGMKLNVTGVTDGSLTIFIDDISSNSITSNSYAYFFYDDITSDYSTEEAIYTFEDVYQCWSDAMLSNTYYKNMYMHVIWERGNSVTQTLETQQVSFKRNVLTTVNINLNGASDENGFNLDIESGEMTNENADFEFDAGDMDDTPVEPTE